jgi:hypothetical protein
MKALENVKTDDLNDEQKKLLSELIKNEMMSTIEDTIRHNKTALVETIKNYIKADEEKSE